MPGGRNSSLNVLAKAIEQDLREINQTLRRPLEAEYAKGQLTTPQRIVMQALYHSEGLSLKELCRRVALSHSTVSGIVDRLQARGMVGRSTDSVDRRVTRITVTPIVREFMQKKTPLLTAQPLLQALGNVPDHDRRTIGDSLRLLRLALSSSRSKP